MNLNILFDFDVIQHSERLHHCRRHRPLNIVYHVKLYFWVKQINFQTSIHCNSGLNGFAVFDNISNSMTKVNRNLKKCNVKVDHAAKEILIKRWNTI